MVVVDEPRESNGYASLTPKQDRLRRVKVALPCPDQGHGLPAQDKMPGARVHLPSKAVGRAHHFDGIVASLGRDVQCRLAVYDGPNVEDTLIRRRRRKLHNFISRHAQQELLQLASIQRLPSIVSDSGYG